MKLNKKSHILLVLIQTIAFWPVWKWFFSNVSGADGNILFLLPLITSTLPAVILFFFVGITGGLFVTPLNAIVQYCTPPENLGAILANNNLIQNFELVMKIIENL